MSSVSPSHNRQRASSSGGGGSAGHLNPFKTRSDRSNYPAEFAQAFEGHGDVNLIAPSPSAVLTPPPMARNHPSQQQQQPYAASSPSPKSGNSNHHGGASPIYAHGDDEYDAGRRAGAGGAQRSQSRGTAHVTIVTTADISSGSDCGSTEEEGNDENDNNNNSNNNRNSSGTSSSATQIQQTSTDNNNNNNSNNNNNKNNRTANDAAAAEETPPPSPIEKEEPQWYGAAASSPASSHSQQVTPGASPTHNRHRQAETPKPAGRPWNPSQQQQQQHYPHETQDAAASQAVIGESFNIGALSPVTAGAASPQAVAPHQHHHHHQHSSSPATKHHQHEIVAVDVRAEEARHLLLFSPRKQQQQHLHHPDDAAPPVSNKAGSASSAVSAQPKKIGFTTNEPITSDSGLLLRNRYPGGAACNYNNSYNNNNHDESRPIVGDADSRWEHERAKSQAHRSETQRHKERVQNVLKELEMVLLADENEERGSFDGATVVQALRAVWGESGGGAAAAANGGGGAAKDAVPGSAAHASSPTAYLERFSSFEKEAAGDFCYYSPHLSETSRLFMTPLAMRSSSSASTLFERNPYPGGSSSSSRAAHSNNSHSFAASPYRQTSFRAATSAVDASLLGLGDRRSGVFGAVDVFDDASRGNHSVYNNNRNSNVFDVLSPQTNVASPGRSSSYYNYQQQQQQRSPIAAGASRFYVGGSSDPQRIGSFFSRSNVRTAEFVFS